MGILANENAIGGGNYLIERSLRFQSASSTYLNRTPASNGNRTTWTWSGWVKRGTLTGTQALFSSGTTGYFDLFAFSGDAIYLSLAASGTTEAGNRLTSSAFRDPSAWYHVVLTIDTTQAIAANRMRIYVNGVEQPYTSAVNPAQNFNTLYFNTTTNQQQGRGNTANYFDGYMAEVNFIDGQALTPSSFGETDATTGVWVAKKYTGTYGTNGFYLKFNDGTSTTTLGQDRSGNANNWTLTNFTRSAGVSDCWMLDVPSGNGSPSATQPSSNYCVLNPLKVVGGNTSASGANLNATSSASAWGTRFTTIGMSSGKWYWEAVRTGNSFGASAGMATEQLTAGDLTGTGAVGWAETGNFCNEAGSYLGTSKTWTTGDILQFRYDADAGQLDINVNNGTWFTLVTGKSGRTWFPVLKCYGGSDAISINLGQRPFAYTPPSGFRALCTANLPAPTIAKGNQYMDATLYTGNSASRSITNAAGFSPDMVWVKARSAATDNYIWDTVRGANGIVTNSTAAEFAGAQVVPTSNGFDLAASTGVNNNTVTYVGWQWDAGTSTVTNTSGTISSQVRANTTAGFSIVTYTGTGANATVGHGLGVAPKMIIVKNRTWGIQEWGVYHSNLTSASYFLYLNLTNAQTLATNVWNATAPTSTVFSVGTNNITNASTYPYVAYCFAEIAGFSRFGSYTGNGSTDGSFVYTGFRPKFVMIKRTDAAYQWTIWDTSRSPNNASLAELYPNLSNAEGTSSGGVDILSNGFKLRGSGVDINANGGTFIYMAFAENPFNFSNAR